MIAADWDQPETVAQLLVLGADTMVQNKNGDTSEQFARGDAATILQSWQKPQVGKENMIKAEKSGNAELVKALTMIGVDRNITEEQLQQQLERNKKLLDAAKKGEEDSVSTLLSEGADLNYKDENGTPIFRQKLQYQAQNHQNKNMLQKPLLNKFH